MTLFEYLIYIFLGCLIAFLVLALIGIFYLDDDMEEY